jgi:hypothetical protein
MGKDPDLDDLKIQIRIQTKIIRIRNTAINKSLFIENAGRVVCKYRFLSKSFWPYT